jgi:hypothetical protein
MLKKIIISLATIFLFVIIIIIIISSTINLQEIINFLIRGKSKRQQRKQVRNA